MKYKRLFLIAGYSAQNKVDASLVFMVKTLSNFGDIVLVMDRKITKTELEKLSPYVIYAAAERHKEYDFGSYKRAYLYAKESDILSEYDFLYLVNDSIYGPLYQMDFFFDQMEKSNADAFGLVCNPHKEHSHIQSWFIGMRQSVFMTKWFGKFITSVIHQDSKGAITYLYEQGFTRLIEANKKTWKCIYSIPGRGIYNDIKKVYRKGLPFMKKVAFTRHNGALGRQILYVLNHTNSEARNAIIAGAKDTFGEQYINWLLTKNPIKILVRNIKYFPKKIFNEGL